MSFGVDLERRDTFRFGFSMLESSNGGLGDYRSVAAGAEYMIGDWRVGFNGTSSEDELLNLEASSASVGASRDLNDHVGLTIGYQKTRIDLKSAPIPVSDNLDQGRVLLELRIRK